MQIRYTAADVEKWLERLAAGVSAAQVMREFGVSETTFYRTFRRLKMDYPGNLVGHVTVPEGHRLRGNSTLLDAAGSVAKRWIKTERDSDDPPDVPKVPEGFAIKKVSTAVDGQGQVRYQWTQADQTQQNRWDQFWGACREAAASYKGIADPAPTPSPATVLSRLLTVYPLGDPHFGMLAWARETGADFDIRIAERDLFSVVDLLVAGAPASERAMLVEVGDFFHAENDSQLTPRGGNKLDVDTRMGKMTEVGFALMRRLIDRLLTKHAKVDVVIVPGNHDPFLARMLVLWLRAVYEREPRVNVFDNNNPYTYVRHGRVLIGTAHNDGAKVEQLPSIMAADVPVLWGGTTFRHWFTGHYHTDRIREYAGCTVETCGTLAGRDYWSHHKGYRHGQSLSAVTFDLDWGEILRSTVALDFARKTNQTKETAQ